jgi:hypothetical protein
MRSGRGAGVFASLPVSSPVVPDIAPNRTRYALQAKPRCERSVLHMTEHDAGVVIGGAGKSAAVRVA